MFEELPEEKYNNQKPEKDFSIFRVLVGVVIGASILIAFILGSNYGENFIFFKTPTDFFSDQTLDDYEPVIQQEQAVVQVVKETSPAVVSIVATKDIPIIERHFETYEDPFGFRYQIPQYEEKGMEKQEIGGGSGFIITSEGMVLTNRHVVADQDADYTIFTSDGESFEAEIIARDPIKDLAVMQIKDGDNFSIVKLGDSSKAIIGQTAIAIGNALGEFKNTVSVGVISGLDRTFNISDGGVTYHFEGVIQTDAAINKGNSGGPLLNLKGEVIGINTAMAIGAQNIGFSIPINDAKRTIDSIISYGEIVYPFLGVRYLIVNDTIKQENNLSVDYGAWIVRGEGNEPAIEPNSAADVAGLQEDDIILEFDGKKITQDNSLARIILDYDPQDKINLKILRGEEEISIEAVLGKRTN